MPADDENTALRDLRAGVAFWRTNRLVPRLSQLRLRALVPEGPDRPLHRPVVERTGRVPESAPPAMGGDPRALPRRALAAGSCTTNCQIYFHT
jgi:hypothetical protein